MAQQVKFNQIIQCGCGIDVHQHIIVATIRRSDTDYETRKFEAYTRSLTELREWCKSEGVTHIAMESTGIYWKPIFNILEEDFEIILVNARHVKNVPGHKTDKKDSDWISKLLLSGLLKGSFIPPNDIRELRDLVRYKRKLTNQAASEKNRLIKVLEDCNIKLSSVVSDVNDGVSATRIIHDIIQGVTDIDQLMTHLHGRIKADREEIRKALEGRVTPHHRFMMRIIKESIEETEKIISKVDRQIDKAVKKYQVELDLLQTIPGVGKDSAISIISEMGVDMNQFPDEQHLSSWTGISPGSNESAGKKKSTRTTHGNKYLRSTLVECGWGASRKRDGFLKRKYESLIARRGKKKALMAVGHQILVAVYFIIKNKEPYCEPVLHDDPKRKNKKIKNYLSRLQELGVTIEVKTAENKKVAFLLESL
jgi:transposase